MRLIDADALMKDLRELLYTDENPSTQLTDAGQAIHNAAIALAASEVMDTPEIDGATVTCAKWQYRWNGRSRKTLTAEGTITCTYCGSTMMRVIGFRYRYCPECGSRMYKEEVRGHAAD